MEAVVSALFYLKPLKSQYSIFIMEYLDVNRAKSLKKKNGTTAPRQNCKANWSKTHLVPTRTPIGTTTCHRENVLFIIKQSATPALFLPFHVLGQMIPMNVFSTKGVIDRAKSKRLICYFTIKHFSANDLS